MLVTLCAVAAKQQFDARQAASRRLSIAIIAEQLVAADEVLRDERGAVDTVRYASGPAGAASLAQIGRLRGRSRAALAALNRVLREENRVLEAPEGQQLARLQARY